METTKPVINSVILKGSNYLLWTRTTKNTLGGRGLWDHIELDQPPKKATKEGEKEDKEGELERKAKWLQDDLSVLAFLQNSLDISILEAYSHCETAKTLWHTLKTVYGNASNLTRVFEVKKDIVNLSQENLEFTKHLGRLQSLWSELEMLRPSTYDPTILNKRKEQDKVFDVLLTLNPIFNDLIKHILRSEKLPTLDSVCSQILKEQGSLSLFGGKRELVMANKGVYKPEEKKVWVCDHCKKRGHSKEKCWILHPHLKPAKFKAHLAHETASEKGSSSIKPGDKTAENASHGDVVRKSDLEALIRAISSLKESGY